MESGPISDPVVDIFDTPRFNRLLSLIEEQNATVETQKKLLKDQQRTLNEHGKKFDILIRDALKDDQPYREQLLDDEPTWSALYEVAAAKMKEEAEEWKSLMDVSLVFIAIFLTVLTAFLVPATQGLSASTGASPNEGGASNSTSLPPLPPRSAENVCALYYVALIMAIFNAVICMLGRQWVGKLLNRPAGKTYRERTIRHEERKTLAYVWIKPLVAVLYWSLLLSIGVFMTGLLYQLRSLSTSFDQNARALEATWALGLVIVSGIVATIAATTIHAVRFEGSPFEGLSSDAMVNLLQRLTTRWKWNWLKGIRVQVDWQLNYSSPQLNSMFIRLIADAQDPTVLDRAVPSFSFETWFRYGDESFDVLKGAYDRLMATDTSLRVRETVKARLPALGYLSRIWLRKPSDKAHAKLKDQEMINFLIKEVYSAGQWLSRVFFTSCREGNEDLRAVSELPFEQCIAKVLCTYDQEINLGDRSEVVKDALNGDEAYDADQLARIFAQVDPCSFLRSSMRQNEVYLSDDLVKFTVRGRAVEIFPRMCPFFNDPTNTTLPAYRWNMSYVLRALISNYPDGGDLPSDIDLSPFIETLCGNAEDDTWNNISDATMRYLNRCNITALSRPQAVRQFLMLCADRTHGADKDEFYQTDEEHQGRAQALLVEHRSFFEAARSPDASAISIHDLPSHNEIRSPSSAHIEMSELPSCSV
ncbi:hypothetical protein SISNIDRAFT_551102 [Sistotremastrum niveocremeum HHB9708]|uniref:DUF6535 domain-containing protein n=1 Tax=Sistotremastrum niveocremeum HHB9708 TaxID=1314777 RepID=A0A164SAI1_9AGAM|nr:hypothetical protein SISNIDRAFT_551102 [Sistotremastrum niveocremeum HHB9708]